MVDLESRCIQFLSTITDPLVRVRVGLELFGKRYEKDIAPLTKPFEYEDDD